MVPGQNYTPQPVIRCQAVFGISLDNAFAIDNN
jgi:hypothetical protein